MREAAEKPSMAAVKCRSNAHREAELAWTYEGTKCASAIMAVGTAFTNFLRDCKKPRKQRRFRYPRFKKKALNESFALSNDQFTKSSSATLADIRKTAARGVMSPRVDSAPAVARFLRLIAALRSRVCSAPHSLQIHSSTCISSRPLGPVRQPQHEQICVDGRNLSARTTRPPRIAGSLRHAIWR